MKGKRGWIRILEATIAVLIVSGTMLAVYSGSSGVEREGMGDYSYSLQEEILADIALRTDLRLNVLGVGEDLPGDSDYDLLEAFVANKTPDSFGYLLRVCELGDDEDFCKMDARTFVATLDKDVFVEEVVISSELGGGSGEEIYAPKKVRLFFWEGGFSADYCRDECSVEDTDPICLDLNTAVNIVCSDSDSDDCLERGHGSVNDSCVSGEVCDGGECVAGSSFKFTCREKLPVGGIICNDGPTIDAICSAMGADGHDYWGDADNVPPIPAALEFQNAGYDVSTYPWFCGLTTGPVNTLLFGCFKWDSPMVTSCGAGGCPAGFEEISQDSC